MPRPLVGLLVVAMFVVGCSTEAPDRPASASTRSTSPTPEHEAEPEEQPATPTATARPDPQPVRPGDFDVRRAERAVRHLAKKRSGRTGASGVATPRPSMMSPTSSTRVTGGVSGGELDDGIGDDRGGEGDTDGDGDAVGGSPTRSAGPALQPASQPAHHRTLSPRSHDARRGAFHRPDMAPRYGPNPRDRR